MISAIRQKTVVGQGGRIEIAASELPPGAVVEVIVFVESPEQDTSEYLFSTEANRRHLQRALKDLGDVKTYVYVDPKDL